MRKRIFYQFPHIPIIDARDMVVAVTERNEFFCRGPSGRPGHFGVISPNIESAGPIPIGPMIKSVFRQAAITGFSA
jgi:hypothetical protein